MNKKQKGMWIALLLTALGLTGCGKTQETIYQHEPDIKLLTGSEVALASEVLVQEESAQEESAPVTEEETVSPTEEEFKEYDIQLMMVGDNLIICAASSAE